MQKVRELKKWQKHVLYFKLVDYFHNFNFLSLAMEYISPYRAMLRQQWSILDQIGPATGPCGTILYLIWYYYPGQKCWIQTLIRIQLNPDLIRTLSRTDPISSVPNQDLTLSPMAYQILCIFRGHMQKFGPRSQNLSKISGFQKFLKLRFRITLTSEKWL